MAFADFDWATDANYPAGAATWSGTATKVAPSAGVQADGFAPEDQPPAQWINWLFNGIVTAGQALELRGLQEAWAQSETNGDTTPHIDVGTQDFRVGTEGIPTLFKVDGVTNRVHIDGVLDTFDAAVSNELTLAGVSVLSITGAGSGGVQSALVQTSGVGGEIALSSGSWTPEATVVSGTGVDTGDLINTFGRWSRVGAIVTFAFHGQVQTGGWTSGLASMSIPLPVSTTHASNDSLSATFTTDNSGSALADSGDGLRAGGESGTDRITLLMNFSAAFVAGSGTANISVSGQYIVA